ncbi:quinoprotein dehydrogenase-associated SoxYZ-like carrier [Escherichia coli]|nr:quinoprotein dehydrogenase-associated SoxYZ-like carrier [Escherichia coli]
MILNKLSMTAAAIALSAGAALANTPPAKAPKDPLDSVMWDNMVQRFFPGGEVIFDNRVKVLIPAAAEDQFFVPVTVDASGLHGVEEIVVVADLNPIPHVLTYKPESAAPFIGFRLKVEQSTPIRAGVRTSDGKWHMGGAVIDAAGGGCSAPAAAHANPNWAATLGQTRAQVRREDADTARITIRMRHPMDTGLANNIPAFYLSRMTMKADDGRAIGTLETFEPVSENPTFTLKAKVASADRTLAFDGRDNEGNSYDFALPVPPESGL